MLKFITNLFGLDGAKDKAPTAPAPYKVEKTAPVVPAKVDSPTAVVPSQTAKKKPAVKKATTRKTRAPKA
jgi:hypothetical protein